MHPYPIEFNKLFTKVPHEAPPFLDRDRDRDKDRGGAVSVSVSPLCLYFYRYVANHSLICGRLCSKPGPAMMSLCPRPGRITSFLGSPAFLYIETDSSIDTRSSASPWSHIIARGEI